MNLYLRLLYVLWQIRRLPRRGVLEDSRVSFRVLPTDCDVNLHIWAEMGGVKKQKA